ncbi:uncharacterized protein [Haliotis asinina]|uniref:uncharacterized protein n=1 Tax=Haliotis asinina TaxID=109174 RepID=UPI003531A082
MMLHFVMFVGLLAVGRGDVFTAKESEDIKGYLETLMGCQDIPGLSIAVVKGNETWSLSLGYANIAAKREVTEETLFGIGSITKSVTATLIALMIDESKGNITFDTTVSELLGEGYDFMTKETTIKDVLSHRTGLSSLTLATIFGGPPGISREDFSKLVGMLPSKPFRGEMLYSNYMYMVAGHITEKVWGASWEENLNTRLLQQIGMTSTDPYIESDDVTEDRYARPYVYLRGELTEGDPSAFDIGNVGPAGSMASNIPDMVKFMRFMLNKGKLENGTQLIKEATIQQLWQPVTPMPPFMAFIMEKLCPQWPVADVSVGYGMGWMRNVYRGRRNIWHAGGLHSYNSLLWLFPDSNVGLHISINGPTLSSSKSPFNMLLSALYYVTDIVLGETPWLDRQTVCTFPKPWFDVSMFVPPSDTDDTPITPEYPLSDYAGSYFNPLVGEFLVTLDKSTDQLRIKLNKLDGVLVPKRDGSFGLACNGVYEFLTWSEKDKPMYMYSAVFIRGADSFDGVDLVMTLPLDLPIRFQVQNRDDNIKTEL